MPPNNSPHLSPKALNYVSNGSGRDSYIGFNCGGLLDAPSKPANYSIGSFRTKTESRSVNNFLPAKHVHYRSDGSGRDKYIIVNEGGLIGEMKRYNYINDLRSYQKRRKIEKNDYFYQTQFFPSLSQSIKKEQIHQSQIFNSQRLSQPRQFTDPYENEKKKITLPGLRRIY
ncbi:hypothetical protein TTHERM_00424680 (macronuclear) [Tetrahymena thermophila SB210]|uniref:Uncharacterized protein n=1 Tax=Tetrahymena thermophila (strain SB210) TaxID=312017 RepID=Q23AJ2_TETTS|nr:hypothetical protein TTHERM_00424680 [Tetrahymena thermophila SB210]EAR93500.2 hypothetical protein TTHERM_00424680 [Tetrahymena thermophila SB210]|eukprot:XP_001013745.2 hypothetical protein TTHERM_00424680 [Tetrahymena thermophila SB210]